MDKRSDKYTNLRVEEVNGFRYVEYTVISTDPESDAIDKVYKYAKENGDEKPKVIGWDFPNLSVEQINVFNMHGYTAAWIVPEGIQPKGLEIKEQKEHKYYRGIEFSILLPVPFSFLQILDCFDSAQRINALQFHIKPMFLQPFERLYVP